MLCQYCGWRLIMKIRGILVWVKLVSPFCTGYNTIWAHVVFSVKNTRHKLNLFCLNLCHLMNRVSRFLSNFLLVVCLSQSISNFYNFYKYPIQILIFLSFFNISYVFNCESNEVYNNCITEPT